MPDVIAIHDILLDRFGDQVIVGRNAEATDPWIEIASASIADVCEFLRDDERLRFDHLNDLTAVDYFEPDAAKRARFAFEPHLEIVYHLSSYETRLRTVLKVRLPRWRNDKPGEPPALPTVSHLWPIAEWHERECYDLFGVWFEGHPNLVRMMMPEDWQGHPLRKDYEWPEDYHGIRTQ